MSMFGMFRKAARDESGVAAITFALAFMPIIGLTGAAIDYSRATQTRAKLQSSLDSAALVAARDGATLTDPQLNARIQSFVQANITEPGVTLNGLTITKTAKTYRVAANATVNTSFMNLVGFNSIQVDGEATSTYGTSNIEIALVLDNTGSMASSSKMTELKKALCGDVNCSNTSPSSGFIKIMKDAAASADRIKVGLVPFDTTVRMPQSIQDQVRAATPTDTSFNNPASNGYCSSNKISNSAKRVQWFRFANKDKDTNAGNYVYEDDDWVYVGSGCGTNGAARATPSTWNGCVWDRDSASNLDITDGSISQTDTNSLHPAVNCRSNSLARILPLSDIWTKSADMINQFATMQPSGNTNLTVGISWGLSLLTNDAPFTEAAPTGTSDLYRFMILLTDGDNTENKFTGTQSQIDARSTAACNAVKAKGITVYTVRVIDGNSTLLSNCASSPANYFEVSNASQLTPVFQTIANQIGAIRLTH